MLYKGKKGKYKSYTNDIKFELKKKLAQVCSRTVFE